MALLLIAVLPFVVTFVLVIRCYRAWVALPGDERPSRGWFFALISVLVLDAFLVIAFFIAIAVFNCHGRYECPV